MLRTRMTILAGLGGTFVFFSKKPFLVSDYSRVKRPFSHILVKEYNLTFYDQSRPGITV